jgi:3-phenylpropionate/cinnamic acid dioxygenase small subunit
VSEDGGALEARLRRLEDIEEIRLLLLEYARCLDAADYAGYAELFTEDGELDARLGRATGRDAIRALLDERLGAASGPPRTPAFHLVGNPVIQVDGDRATSSVLWAYITHDERGYPLILQLGHYRDELAREDGVWRFRRREISRDLGFSPLDAPDRT